jgi:regulator of PEP synthase PpsR (kinase-PPPase family)
MTMTAKTSRRKTPPVPHRLYVFSDSTGNLARHMMRAFQTQFPPQTLSIHVEPFVRTLPHLKKMLAQAKGENASVCHAMISDRFKNFIGGYCAQYEMPCCDLTGNVVQFLSEVTRLKPSRNVESLHEMDALYKRRIGALEFTISHDDGLGLPTLHEADVVIVGASRTSKTPTSIYLAQQGYSVGNVSLAMPLPPPAELLAMPAEKVVGIFIRPEQLVMVRSRRQAALGYSGSNYAELEHVEKEVTWTRRLFAGRGWYELDVTDQAIEETAARIVETAQLHAPDAAAAPRPYQELE